MLKFIATIITLLCLNSLSGQWQWVNPQPQGNDLNDVCAIDGVVYAVGGYNTIIKSVDGGETWQRQVIDTNMGGKITQVDFVNAQVGYVSVMNDFIYKTIDGGNNWQRLLQCQMNALTVQCIGSNNVIAAGLNGKFASSNDGGQTWTISVIGNGNFDIFDVDFVSPHIGWAVGDRLTNPESSVFFKTMNGGQTWIGQDVVISGTKKNAIEFIDSLHGWCNVYKYMEIMNTCKTIDGGQTWTISNGNGGETPFIKFINNDIGFVNYDSKTTNGGQSFYATNLNIPPVGAIVSMDFDGSQIGYMVGEYGMIYKTTDGGDNWVSLSTHSTPNLYAVTFTNAQTGYAAGDNSNSPYAENYPYKGIILKTISGGESWSTPLNTGTAKPLKAIQFPSEETGYAAGENGTIIKTVNSGDSWTILNTGTTQNLNSISFPDIQTGYAAGLNGTIIKTVDAGLTWSNVNSGITGEILSLCFTDSQIGYFGNENGQIYKTIDGGINWILNFTYSDRDISAIYFKNSLNGFAGNSYGKILKTVDGGQSWSIYELPYLYSGYGIKSFNFPSSNVGYATCASSLMKTTDAGESWIPQQVVSNKPLNSVFFTNENFGTAVGFDGVIIRTTNGGETSIKPDLNNSPQTALLMQNYPNPFNPTTEINYELKTANYAKLAVYNAKGELVKILVEGIQTAGNHSVKFEAINLNSGVYFYKLEVDGNYFVHKMILLK